MKNFRIKRKAELFPQKGGWVYVRVPLRVTKSLSHMADRGLIPITAKVGSTSWETSLLPMGDGTHFIALNEKKKKREDISVGSEVSLSFSTR